MEQAKAWETASQVLAEAARSGVSVTPSQLHRYQREGLIPRPTQRGAGRKRGSVAVYPPGTARQLIALDRFMKIERKVASVRWRLWRNRLAVDSETARAQVIAVLTDVRDGVERLVSPDGPLTKEAFAHFRNMANRKTSSPLMSQMRESLGRAALLDLFVLYTEAFTGTLGTWRRSEARDPVTAFTRMSAFLMPGLSTTPDEDSGAHALRSLKSGSIEDALTAVRDAPIAELERARDKCLTVAFWFAQLLLRVAPRETPYTVDDVSAENQMLLFGLFLSVARAATVAQGRDVLGDIPTLPIEG